MCGIKGIESSSNTFSLSVEPVGTVCETQGFSGFWHALRLCQSCRKVRKLPDLDSNQD
jgi:hypothetical protein